MPAKQLKAIGEMDMGEGLKVTVNARQFEIHIDEPLDSGGLDTGMTPVEALLGALAACKSVVTRVFARLHRIKLESIRIECVGDINTDGYMLKDKTAKKGFSHIKTIYHIKADNTPEEIKNYIAFVESNCPVSDTIVNTPTMEEEINIL